MTILNFPKTIPRYGRALVPWVTRWSGEVFAMPYRVAGVAGDRWPVLFYPNSRMGYIDTHGVLWQPEGILRNGKPLYAEVNTPRQRTAMRKMLCQVCGVLVTERPITSWLMTEDQWQPLLLEQGRYVTTNPPTCSTCEPIALAFCPYLQKPGTTVERITAHEWRPFGVQGEGVLPDMTRVNNALYEYGKPGARSFIAKVAAVEITRMDRERVT